MSALAFALHTDALGRLVLTDAHGTQHTDVVAARAFPVSAPEESVSLLDADGHELAWIERLGDCPEPERTAIAHALARREFMPVLQRLKSVSSYATPSTWDVETDRGATQFVLKGEEHIRRLGPDVLIVTDAFGVQYLIRDLDAMDRASRKLLDRFL